VVDSSRRACPQELHRPRSPRRTQRHRDRSATFADFGLGAPSSGSRRASTPKSAHNRAKTEGKPTGRRAGRTHTPPAEPGPAARWPLRGLGPGYFGCAKTPG
jgi:hypothetical protein